MTEPKDLRPRASLTESERDTPLPESGVSGAARAAIRNPILPGFNPDPSILRVGADYYIATSTFEWFPGVQIHHSRDLVHWRLLTRPLNRRSQLNMAGNPRSGGIWAPCLSYSNGLFYLIYTDVKNWGHRYADTHNYLVTASNIEGPWSEPVYLNSSGFDPSLFHDDEEHGGDGRKWFVNMLWDHRPGRNQFAGILLQEFDPIAQKLTGPIKNICQGSQLGVTEGPHLYKKGELYYLMLAEGGTSWDHAVTLARSKSIDGPYELDPQTPLLTSAADVSLPLQKAGHASLVETQKGEWYLAHLCGRPQKERRCSLGRETSIQKMMWDENGWLRLEDGGNRPSITVAGPKLDPHPWPHEPMRDDFDSAELSIHFQTLRTPASDDWFSLRERPGVLRLRGRESPRSLHRQSLVARRLQSFKARFQTSLEFEPETFQQMAGLICFYDDENYCYLQLTHDEAAGKCLQISVCELGILREELSPPLSLPMSRDTPIHLRADFENEQLHLSFSTDGEHFKNLGPPLDSTRLSDEFNTMGLGFTGTFVGMCAHDMTGRLLAADFHYFECDQHLSPPSK